MEEFVLRTFGLTKKFGNKIAVNNVSLNIRRGDIYGFIGPNGAGKTTAMKVVLDLMRPTMGEIELFGKMKNKAALIHVGSLIESPGLYTSCSAYENMKRFSILFGGTDDDIAYFLRMVGLEGVGKKKVGIFSLGMKQRLGIAIALLGNPEFLVLDEPVNGLDPMGMKDIRDILTFINREKGTTIFISSHLLGELEKMATVYGIINCGTLIEEITISELEKRCSGSIIVRCSEAPRAAALVRENFGIDNIQITDGQILISAPPAISARVNEVLVKSGIFVSELGIQKISSEEYFLNRMGSLNVGMGVGQYA